MGLGRLLGGAARTPSSNPTKVLVLHPCWSVCASPALPAPLSLFKPQLPLCGKWVSSHPPGPRGVRGSQAVDVLKSGPPQA